MKISRFIHDNWYKIFQTLLCYLCFFCLGSATTLLGSSILDLQISVQTDFATISYLVPVRSAGHIVGCILAAIVDRKFNQSFILFFTNLVAGIFLGVAPLFSEFIYVAMFLFIAGVNHGIADICCNTMVANTWKAKCANWLQILHMSWGVGSLTTPVICRPFLLPTTEEDIIENIKLNAPNVTLPIEDNIAVPIVYTAGDVKIQYGYFIIGAISIIISLPFGGIYLRERQAKNDLKIVENKKINPNPTASKYKKWQIYTAVFFVASITHLVYSVEALVGSLGTSFSVKSDLHMDKRTGVLLATVFWSCFSFYRLIYIPLTFVISDTKLLLSSLTISLVGVLVIVPWANYEEYCIWIGFTLIGVGISPIFSAAYSMLSRYVVIDGVISSMIFIPGIIGESLHPAIAAALMVNHTISFLYYIGVLGISFVILFLILLIYCKKVFKTTITQLSHREIGERLSTLCVSRY